MAHQWLVTRIVFRRAGTGFCTKSLFYGARGVVILSAPSAREGSASTAREGSASTVRAALSS